MLADGGATITTTEITDNAASVAGGGIAVVDGGAQLALVASLVTRNTAPQGGGLHSTRAVTCTGTATAAHGFLANTGDGVHVAGGTFGATSCDFGTSAATNNAPVDVRPGAAAGVDFGDNATFSCTPAGCN